MGQRKWFALLVACVLHAACVAGAPRSEKPATGTAAAKQRAKGIEFPNTAVIAGDLTEQLGVDRFFSNWVVFLNDDIATSDKEFTILAPSNKAKIRPADESSTRQLLLNHIVLGKALRAADLRKPVTVTTLGGQQIKFQPRKDGSVSANGVAVLKSDVQVPQGVILVLDDYLTFDPAPVDPDDPNASSMTISSHDGITMIEIGTHDPEATSVAQDEAAPGTVETLPRQLNSGEPRPFIQDLFEALNFLRSGTSDFLRYLTESNLAVHFKDDEEYTAFVPMDDSFASWYPIDWGFNPFVVPEFVQETMLNHFVKGKHCQDKLKDNTTLKTLGGKQLVIRQKPTLNVNGIDIFVGDSEMSRGCIQFINDLLFVTFDKVAELNKKHKDKESAPLLPSPWYGSQFLAHTFQMLQTRQATQHVTDYLNRTHELLNDLPGHDASWGMLLYTFFVPEDSSFLHLLPQDTADPYIIDSDFRHDMLLSHFVRQRLYAKDLVDGSNFTTANNKTVKVTKSGGDTFVNGAKILESDLFVYNLGNIFVIDKVLFAERQAIERVLDKHRDVIPSFAGGIPPPPQPESNAEATEVVDLLVFLNEDSTGESQPIKNIDDAPSLA